MADNGHKSAEAQKVLPPAAGWAPTVIMSAMFGIVLLATLPNLIGYPASRGAETGLPPLLGFVRGV